MPENTTGFDTKFYEAALADSLSKAMDEGNVEEFDKAIERITEYAVANPEEGVATTAAEYKLEVLTGIVHGFLDATRSLQTKKTNPNVTKVLRK
jgi:hypothetical protein